MAQRDVIVQDLAIKVRKGEMNLEDIPDGFREEVEVVLDEGDDK